jgi:hypothetical protein
VQDGPASAASCVKPSKPFLLYAKFNVNNIPLQSSLDTGASATCISAKVLQNMNNVRYIDTTPCFLVLADGVVPLEVKGSVKLHMRVCQELITIHALVAEKLCMDLILGMDFMIVFQVTINVESQTLSLLIVGRQTIIPVDDQIRRPLIPLHSCYHTIVPINTTVSLLVSSQISSISAYVIPTSLLIELTDTLFLQQTVIFENHQGFLRKGAGKNLRQCWFSIFQPFLNIIFHFK